ncbi:trypsin-like peptidase domain-containing protein [Gemmatimonadota bacterium]
MTRIFSFSGGVLALLLVFSLGIPSVANAQRDELIRNAMQAYDDFETETALGLLKVAVNPAVGPTDSVWAAGIQLLSQMLIEEGQDSLATVWMRWAVRTAPNMRVDRVTYLPEVVDAYESARRVVGTEGPGDAITRTSWEWDAGFGEEMGALDLRATGMGAPISVEVVGIGVVGTGSPVRLRPSSYTVRASAEGYLETEVTREVLPGIVTVLDFNLTSVIAASLPDSVIADDAEASALRHLGRLRVTRFGSEPSCGAGVFVGSDGLFLTTYRAIRGAESLEVRLSDGTEISDGISVAAYDTDGVAVLQLPRSVGDSLEVTDGPDNSQYVWALGYPNCGTATVSASRVAGQPAGGVRLSDSLAFGDQGGPLVDQMGSVVGLTTGGFAAVPADRAMASLDEARSNIRSQRLLSLLEVAETERHRYGAVSISSDLRGSVVRISPLESWHWQDAGGGGPLPLSFSGPMGRYRIQMLMGSQVRRTEEFTLNPAVTETLALLGQIAVETPGETQASVRDGGGGFPVAIVALIGLAGAGAAVGLLAGGGGGGTDPNTCPTGQRWDGTRCVPITTVTTGGIIISIPNP